MVEPTTKILDVHRPITGSEAEDIKALWNTENVVVDDVTTRLSEIRTLAYAGDVLVGAGALNLMNHNATGKRVYNCRIIVSSKYRSQQVAPDMYRRMIESAEEQFDAGTDTDAIGVFIEWQAGLVSNWEGTMCSFSFEHSTQPRAMQLNLTGITDNGLPQYIYYFENASLFSTGPVFEEKRSLDSDETATISLSFCWQNLTGKEQDAVTTLWLTNGVIKDRELCQRRLPDVAALARIGNEIVGVASIFQAPYEPANAVFLGYRSFVSPRARGGFTATRLLKHTYAELNKIYEESESIKHLQGIAYVLQNDKLNRRVHKPMGPDVRSFLIGYLKEMQMRVRYFDGAKVSLHRDAPS